MDIFLHFKCRFQMKLACRLFLTSWRPCYSLRCCRWTPRQLWRCLLWKTFSITLKENPWKSLFFPFHIILQEFCTALYIQTGTWQHVDMIRVRSEIPVVRDTLQSGVTPAPISQITFSCGASSMPHIIGLINNAGWQARAQQMNRGRGCPHLLSHRQLRPPYSKQLHFFHSSAGRHEANCCLHGTNLVN